MNRVMLIGNLASDPEKRTTQSGLSTCTFRLAVQRRYKNADGTREADFIPVVCWRQLADLVWQYLSKGSRAAVEGSMQVRSYTAQDGTKRYVTEVIAEHVEFLTPREAGSAAEAAEHAERPHQTSFRELSEDEYEGLPF